MKDECLDNMRFTDIFLTSDINPRQPLQIFHSVPVSVARKYMDILTFLGHYSCSLYSEYSQIWYNFSFLHNDVSRMLFWCISRRTVHNGSQETDSGSDRATLERRRAAAGGTRASPRPGQSINNKRPPLLLF